jgi:hypothetical protein
MKTCEDTLGMIGDRYLRCGEPACMLIDFRGGTEGPYWMCAEHGTHALDNRSGRALPFVIDELTPFSAEQWNAMVRVFEAKKGRNHNG